MCGIRLSEGKLKLCPKPDPSLGFAKAEWRSPVGTIRSAWRYEDDRLIFDFSSPIPAAVKLPNGESFTIEAGEAHHEVLL